MKLGVSVAPALQPSPLFSFRTHFWVCFWFSQPMVTRVGKFLLESQPINTGFLGGDELEMELLTHDLGHEEPFLPLPQNREKLAQKCREEIRQAYQKPSELRTCASSHASDRTTRVCSGSLSCKACQRERCYFEL